MSKLVIETQYFPPIATFAEMHKVDEVYIEAYENYQKRSYRNRAHIAGPNGFLRLSIPLEKGKNEKQLITNVSIVDDIWRNEHVQSIKSAYSNAPFYIYYADGIFDLMLSKEGSLFTYNWNITKHILSILSINTNLFRTIEYINEVDCFDLRNQISPRAKDKIYYKAPFYEQVFEEKYAFIPNLSILDLLFCKGPESIIYLQDYNLFKD